MPASPTLSHNSSSLLEDQFPKTEGYPAFCQHLATASDFFILRRFGEENALVLLNLQNKIMQLRARLDYTNKQSRLDRDEKAGYLDSLTSIYVEQNPWNQERVRILETLQTTLQTYNEHIIAYSQLRKQESAQKYQVRSLENWHTNHRGAIIEPEHYHVGHRDDLICVGYRSKTPAVLLFERSGLLRWLFRKRGRDRQVSDTETKLWSDKLMQGFSDLVVVLLGLIMLYAPMWWLNWVADDTKRLAIITGFVAIFAMGLMFVGSGRPFETLGATAAYAAVLMVFMQKSQSNV